MSRCCHKHLFTNSRESTPCYKSCLNFEGRCVRGYVNWYAPLDMGNMWLSFPRLKLRHFWQEMSIKMMMLESTETYVTIILVNASISLNCVFRYMLMKLWPIQKLVICNYLYHALWNVIYLLCKNVFLNVHGCEFPKPEIWQSKMYWSRSVFAYYM